MCSGVVNNTNNTNNDKNKKNPIIRCGGIIFNKDLNSVLIVLNKFSFLKGEHKWGFPKGHRHEGEKIFQCAKREIREETGLNLPNKVFKKKIYIYNTVYYVIFLDYDYNEFNIFDKNEIAKVEWVTLEQLKNNNYNRDIRKFLEKNYMESNFDYCEKRLERCRNEPVKVVFNNQVLTN